MRSLVASFAIKSWESVTEDYVWNAWRHHPFLHFPDEDTHETAFEDDDGLSHSSSEAGSKEEDKEGEGEEQEEEEEEEEEEDATAVQKSRLLSLIWRSFRFSVLGFNEGGMTTAFVSVMLLPVTGTFTLLIKHICDLSKAHVTFILVTQQMSL